MNNNTNDKECVRCHNILSLSNFYKVKNGFTQNCKKCRVQQQKERRRQRGVVSRRIPKETDPHHRECFFCNQVLEITKFPKNVSITHVRKCNNCLSKYLRELRKNNLNFKLACIFRTSVRNCLQLENNCSERKLLSTQELIGISFIELRNYLERLFEPHINWENHGKVWEIDHIIPCSLFDLKYKEAQLLCCNYKNLRPLCKIQNKCKHDILPDGTITQNLTKISTKIELLRLMKNWPIDLSWIINDVETPAENSIVSSDFYSFYLKSYKFINPLGQPVEVKHLSKFCEENKLNNGHMWSVAAGNVNHHQGWRKFDETLIGVKFENRKFHKIISPTGELIIIENMLKFCRENSLSPSLIYQVLRGKRNHHFHWIKYNH